MPNWELVIGGRTIIPEPFWGRAAFPLFVFIALYAWPALERRFTRDQRQHDLLDRPRDHPTRTAIGAAFLSWVVIVFAVGSTDRIFYRLHISYTAQIHFWRAGIWVLPIIVFYVTRAGARALRRSDEHPLRGWQGDVVARGADGSVRHLAIGDDGGDLPPSERPLGTVPGEPG
jgi:ubiquinol-cytochrome c reductase cytochrome b subunit